MGAKDWMLSYADGEIRPILQSVPTIDRGATQALVRQLYPARGIIEDIGAPMAFEDPYWAGDVLPSPAATRIQGSSFRFIRPNSPKVPCAPFRLHLRRARPRRRPRSGANRLGRLRGPAHSRHLTFAPGTGPRSCPKSVMPLRACSGRQVTPDFGHILDLI
jgi:hypothetical protein